MSTEPTPPSAKARPGASLRRKALGMDPSQEVSEQAGSPDPASPPSTAPPSTPSPVSSSAPPSTSVPGSKREDLATSLARIPDLRPDEVVDDQASQAVRVAATTAAQQVEADQARREDEPAPSSGGPIKPLQVDPLVVRSRQRPPWWRRVAFAMSVLVLVSAIPALGYFGSQLIKDSTAGSFAQGELGPEDPGFEAPVEPTPTALAIQYDDDGVPNGLTFLSTAGEAGGSVIFVPLDTEVATPKFGVDHIRQVWELTPKDQPSLGRDRLVNQVGSALKVGIQEPFELTNAAWEQLVTPVAPLRINNPDDLDFGYGITLASGEVELPADLVGPYLAKQLPGESDLNRLVRHEIVWRAWLEQVAEAGPDKAVPGESDAGIGRFIRTLAAGPVDIQTLPVNSEVGDSGIYKRDQGAIDKLMASAVASPTPAMEGSRFTVRLLNGVSADPIPGDVIRSIVSWGGAVMVLGNGPEFGTDKTSVVYADKAMSKTATLVGASLGAKGEIRHNREAPDSVDLTIVLGRDVLASTSGATSGSGSTSTPMNEGN
ncbi:MAG: hypothetical protein KDA95_09510 [Acidimicrobiales bacterium]|nr:hypothetical protein [Acidimicrobiales bacterium]